MMIFDRGLTLGSCLSEASVIPLVVLAVATVSAAAAAFLLRRFAVTSVRFLPWLILGIGFALAGITGAALAFGGNTARLEAAGGQLTVGSCRSGTEERISYALSAITTRFHVRTNRKGAPTPLVRFLEGDRQVAEIWLGHPGVDLGALARVAPEAVAEYRRWQAP